MWQLKTTAALFTFLYNAVPDDETMDDLNCPGWSQLPSPKNENRSCGREGPPNEVFNMFFKL